MRFCRVPLFSAIAPILFFHSGVNAQISVVDDLHRTVILAHPAGRIVSLAPSITECLFALGAGDQVKGVTDFCNYPPAAQSKPKVGGPVNPNLERILELRPSLVLTTEEGNPLETVARLERLGLRVFAVRPGTYAGVQASIEVLSRVFRAEVEAARLVQNIQDRVAAVRRRVAGRHRPRVLFLVWTDPLIAAGPATFVHDLIEMAGGDNIVRERTVPYPRLSWEEIVGRAPEVILVASHRDGAGPPPNGAIWNAWRSIPAVRSGRILSVHADTILRPGPRVVEGVERLGQAIHPETFLPEDTR
jgi:iron complex transport system substrate-binding protein